MSETIITCSACTRALLEKKVLGPASVAGFQRVVYRQRPFWACVLTRSRLIDYDGPFPPPPPGERSTTTTDGDHIIEMREYPVVCSRECLDKIRADERYVFSLVLPGVTQFGIQPARFKDGDDLLDGGPPPSSPSDEWAPVVTTP